MKVQVHRNLNNGLWSVVSLRTNLVIAHAESITLVDAVCKVSQAGRARAIRSETRNVHAAVHGTCISATGITPFKRRKFDVPETTCPDDLNLYQKFWYNPFKCFGFTTNAGVIASGDAMYFDATGASYVLNPVMGQGDSKHQLVHSTRN